MNLSNNFDNFFRPKEKFYFNLTFIYSTLTSFFTVIYLFISPQRNLQNPIIQSLIEHAFEIFNLSLPRNVFHGYSTKIVHLAVEGQQRSFLESGRVWTDKSDWQQERREKYAIFVARVFRAAACDTHVRHRDLHYWSVANIVGPVYCESSRTLPPLPLVPGRIASRATLPLSRSRGWRLETTIFFPSSRPRSWCR